MSQQTLKLPNGQQIPYTLVRKARKTIGLRINDDGLLVSAPIRVSHIYLEAVLFSKARWILTKLEARQARALTQFIWQEGACIRLLGAPIYLALQSYAKKQQIELIQDTLHVASTKAMSEMDIAKRVTQWLKQYALEDFNRRISLFSAKLGKPVNRIYLSNAKSRWGSCNSKGEIRLNWRLIQAPPHIINYVVCHELAHLCEMNHSAKFWKVVEGLCPQYSVAEQELKSLSNSLHQLD